MTIIEKLALSLVLLFSILMIGPVFGMPFVGDIELHAALLFEAVPASLIAAFVVTVALHK